MDKQAIIDFFDGCAPFWDRSATKDPVIIDTILSGANLQEGMTVLDVATGTGILIPDYLARKVGSITAVDFSAEMIEIAKSKYQADNLTLLCCDVFDLNEWESYDCIVVYNAFPHFPDPAAVISHLSRLLRPGGTLTVAHGMSRAALAKHHSGAAQNVSIELLHEDALAKLMASTLTVTVKISNDQMYQVSGAKPQ